MSTLWLPVLVALVLSAAVFGRRIADAAARVREGVLPPERTLHLVVGALTFAAVLAVLLATVARAIASLRVVVAVYGLLGAGGLIYLAADLWLAAGYRRGLRRLASALGLDWVASDEDERTLALVRYLRHTVERGLYAARLSHRYPYAIGLVTHEHPARARRALARGGSAGRPPPPPAPGGAPTPGASAGGAAARPVPRSAGFSPLPRTTPAVPQEAAVPLASDQVVLAVGMPRTVEFDPADPFTTRLVIFQRADTRNLAIHPRGKFEPRREVRTVTLGRPSFDRAFLAVGHDPAILAALVTPEVEARLLNLRGSLYGLVVNRYGVCIYLEGRVTDPGLILDWLELGLELNRRLPRKGGAAGGSPASADDPDSAQGWRAPDASLE